MLSSILQKKVMRKRDAKEILSATDKAGEIDRFKKMMWELASETGESIKFLRYKTEYLKLLPQSVLLLIEEWQNLASANV